MPKGLFIGLGGTGVATLSKLKAKIFHDAYGQDKVKMDNDCKFIFYDTDLNSKKIASKDAEISRLMGQKYSVIDEDEYITAATVKPYSLYKAAKNAPASDLKAKRMLEWVIDPDAPRHVTIEDKELGQGAGANRQKGRFGIMAKIEDFEKKIKRDLDDLNNAERQGENQEVLRPHIWVFASSNGGTSSSALLDVLYLTNRVYRGIYQADPYLRLVMYMPKPFIDKNLNSKTGYSLGGYSTLWELNAFRLDRTQDNDGKKFGTFAVRPDINSSWKNDPWPVCTYVMAVDIESESGKLNDLDQMIDNTANLCYYIHTSSVGESMVSNLDNDFDTDKDFYKKVNHPQNEKFAWGYYVVGSGYKTLAKADNFLKEYIKRRFRYDLFGYGFVGKDFVEILPNDADQKAAVKAFANKYILEHLVNVDNYDKSQSGSLYSDYQKKFDAECEITISQGDKISKDDWNSSGSYLIESCNKTRTNLIDEFRKGEKTKFLKKIENSIREGVDNCVVEYGLKYTIELLRKVDNEFLEKEILGKLKTRPTFVELQKIAEGDLETIDESIKGIILKKNRRKAADVGELINKMTDYRNKHVQAIALEHISDIITEITHNDTALLERLRNNGDKRNIMGLDSLREAFEGTFLTCETDFNNIVGTFKETKNEPCTDYFPRVRDMVDEQSAWVKNNKFEELYSSVVLLDKSENAITYKDNSHGCPPQRYSSEVHSLAYAIKEIKRIDGHQNLFADMAMGNEDNFRELRGKLEERIDSYIDELITSPSRLQTWLTDGLEKVFEENFKKKDGTTDIEAKRKYINEFKANIPVFYPTKSDKTGNVRLGERILCVGKNQDFFKQQMEYKFSDEIVFQEDSSTANQIIVCKFESGHNFYDYKYFDELNDKYEENIEDIKSGRSSCHIHQKFLTRDIVKAFESRKAKRFDDFVKLCWFDSYFEMLNKYSTTKELVEAVFGQATTNVLGDDVLKRKKSAKSLDETSDILEDDLLVDSLSDNIDVSLGLEDDTENEDISIDMDEYGDEFDVDENPIEEGLSTGYSPIVTIKDSLDVEIKALKMSEMAGVLAFKDDERFQKSIAGMSLLQVRKNIINNLDNIDYANMFFANFSSMFGSFDDEMRKKLVSIHRVHRDKVRAIFINKISPILKKRKINDVNDKKVFQLLNLCVKRLFAQDIFN